MNQVVIVIGDRLGKGQNVGKGIEAAGGKAIVIEGVTADMKLGDVMKAENADIGISFCGSGGAGAITAQNKYGYKARYGMKSIQEGRTAVQDGIEVLGFSFMDQKELGEEITKELIRLRSEK